jgi:aminoglycoside phosphotransferase (APT) family kinase protein
MKAAFATASSGRATTLRRVDRFVAPSGHAEPARFIADYLYVAHNVGERLAWPLHRALGGRLLGMTDTGGSAAAEAAIADLRRVLPDAAARASSWVVDTDYAGSPRGRSVAFLFGQGERHPSLVVKRARLAAPGEMPSLRHERETIDSLGRTLPDAIARTIPRVVAYECGGAWETLALTWLPGRSAYAEMHTRLAPAGAVEEHFERAARWLARFHEATAIRGETLQPAEREGEIRETLAARGLTAHPGWFARLCDWCTRHPVSPVRSHGDFWARNLLISGRDVSGVVDWEQSANGSPFDDLFHFAASYGLSYPWRRYRRASPEEALRRTFLVEGRVSRAVRAYLHAYCRDRGFEASELGSWFRLFVLARAQAGAPKGEVWIRFDEMLGATDRSVFSG